MGVLPQALEIIFEVQLKLINEKTARRKNTLSNSQTHFFFFFFFSLGLSYFQSF
jgi:hypothetical protein